MDTYFMKTDRLGERSVIIRELDESPVTAAAKFRAYLPDLEDAVPCYATVGLYFSNNVPSVDELHQALSRSLTKSSTRQHEIPVCYEMGPDLEAAAKRIGTSVSELVQSHHSTTYSCAAVGFVPGFAYLGDLPLEIAGLPRLATPRVKVPAGSVAITGLQTAVYPVETPGGWWLIGRTPLTVVSEVEAYFPIAPGDKIQFRAIDADEYRSLEGRRL